MIAFKGKLILTTQPVAYILFFHKIFFRTLPIDFILMVIGDGHEDGILEKGYEFLIRVTSERDTLMNTRQKILYLIASVFLIWHTFALLIGPAPQSYIRDNLLGIYEPYLSVFRLNNAWAFYAPEPDLGGVLNYKVLDNDGNEHQFDIYHDYLDRWSASYFRYNAFFNNIEWNSAEYRRYRKSYIQYLCRKHSNLSPKSIALIRIAQIPLSPEDYINGARPLDPDFTESRPSEPTRC